MNDYKRIEEVIRFLDQHHLSQPSVAHMAAVAGLSESRLHRLFQRWAGTTPKAFLKCLTIEHAKKLLDQSLPILDTALDSGLSGPGRLHDLFVTMHAVSPGEYKAKGKGVAVTFGSAQSPFGLCHIASTERGICHLEFIDEEDSAISLPDCWSKASLKRDDAAAKRLMTAIFRADKSINEPLNLLVHGTAFQLKVWRALLRIPEGQLSSYGNLAGKIGSPGASRAVGTACGANPIAYLIPCHRVIQQTGVVKGYRWGETRKKALLVYESAEGGQ
ncbi:methylated-DNA--[protein]-cysteine S-methyltransferase [Verrucomicrobiales bacterium BCK34]|nr:methylated-DNA--[protein]-cysteine S-methyltransferase [Verrucomicrobiales bacterium BCK34]